MTESEGYSEYVQLPCAFASRIITTHCVTIITMLIIFNPTMPLFQRTFLKRMYAFIINQKSL